MQPSVGFVCGIFGNVRGVEDPIPVRLTTWAKRINVLREESRQSSKIDLEEIELVNRRSQLESSHEAFCGPR